MSVSFIVHRKTECLILSSFASCNIFIDNKRSIDKIIVSTDIVLNTGHTYIVFFFIYAFYILSICVVRNSIYKIGIIPLRITNDFHRDIYVTVRIRNTGNRTSLILGNTEIEGSFRIRLSGCGARYIMRRIAGIVKYKLFERNISKFTIAGFIMIMRCRRCRKSSIRVFIEEECILTGTYLYGSIRNNLIGTSRTGLYELMSKLLIKREVHLTLLIIGTALI